MRRRVHSTSFPLAAAVLVLACPRVFAQQDAPKTPSPSTEAAETITVTAERRKLAELRARMVEVEDRLYARFNDLNKEDEYDIVCRISAPTGTQLKQRVCKPQLVETLTAAEAQDVLRILRDERRGGRPRGEPANWTLRNRKAEYTRHVLSVLRADADLLRMAREREALQAEYDELQRQVFQDR